MLQRSSLSTVVRLPGMLAAAVLSPVSPETLLGSLQYEWSETNTVQTFVIKYLPPWTQTTCLYISKWDLYKIFHSSFNYNFSMEFKYLRSYFSPWQQIGVMLTWSNKHNRWLIEGQCLYKFVNSSSAPTPSEYHHVMFRGVDCIANDVSCFMSAEEEQST